MKGYRIFGAVFGAAIAAATAGPVDAQAGVLTQTFGFDFGNDRITLVVGPNASHSAVNTQVARTHAFDQFDASLGTLEAVSFTIGMSGTRIGGVTHNNGGQGSININVTNRFGFDFGGGIVEGSSTASFQRSESPWNLALELYKGFSQNVNSFAAFNQTIDFFDWEFAQFVGGGTLDLEIYDRNVFESLTVSGDGLIATAIFGSCNPNCGNFVWAGPIAGTASLTYTFREPTTAIPEPAALALFGAGLAALGLVRRRQRAG